MQRFALAFSLIRLPVDFILIILALFSAYFLRPYSDLIPGVQYYFDPTQLPTLSYYWKFAVLNALVLMSVMAWQGVYRLHSRLSRLQLLGKITSSTIIWGMIVISYYVLIIHQLLFSRVILVHSLIFVIIFLWLGRLILRLIAYKLREYGYGRANLILVGYCEDTCKVLEFYRQNPAYKILGLVGPNRLVKIKEPLKIIGALNDLGEIVRQKSVDIILGSEAALNNDQIGDLIDLCQEEYIAYKFLPDMKHFSYANISTDLIAGRPVLSVHPTALGGWGRIVKRLFDIIVSSLGLLLLLPIFILIALKIKLDSSGSVFYKSRRVGVTGKKIFGMYKFRSMVIDAETQKLRLAQRNHREGPLFKIKNDPRITKFGKFLRKTSFDEFPQLINVWFGEMSLVGPRAHLKEEVAKYEKHHKLVLAIKPGITGLAQINGRSDLDFEDEVRFDTFYIKNWSFWFDLKILIKTIRVVLKGDGAD